MSALGEQPSYYLRFFEWLLCDAKQPHGLIPGSRLSSAKSGRSLVLGNLFGRLHEIVEFDCCHFLYFVIGGG